MSALKQLTNPELYRLVWIAVITVELTVALAMLDEEHSPPTDFRKNEADGNHYVWGEIGKHNIVVASLPAGPPGQNNAATTIACLKSSLPHINLAVLVGIGGGTPKTTGLANNLCIDKNRDVRLGDVVVGLPGGSAPGVLQYDYGKMKQGKGYERAGALNLPPPELLSVVKFLQSKRGKIYPQMQQFIDDMIRRDSDLEEDFRHQGVESDRLFRTDYVHRTEDPDCSSCCASKEISRPTRKSTLPLVHYGAVLSGNTVMRDAEKRDAIATSTAQDSICYEMEAAAIVGQVPCLVIRGICDYADSHKNDVWQPYAAATAAAYAKLLICTLDSRVKAEKIPSQEVALLLAPVSKSVEKLQAQNERIQQSCETAASAAELEVLSHLPISIQARYDSWEESKSPLCLPKTREGVFKQLFEWLEKERPRTLCLNGMAGTGKSTISRSFAQSLHERGQLGASFFFKRDDSERGEAQKLSSTIAADLARRFSTARASIVDTVKSYDGIAHTEAQNQFQLLVLDPLSKIQPDKNIAIVIDAVDECVESDLECFFALVSAFQRAELPRVKLFFTSRPDLAVLQEFDTETDECATIALHKVPEPIIEHDIRIFLKHELCKVRKKHNRVVDVSERLGPDWPSIEDEERLLKRSNQLFIFAATICRLLYKCSKSSPDLQLSNLLELKTTTDHAFEPIYKPVLIRQIPSDMDISEDEKEELICEYKQVLGALCVLRSPVSVPALARLLGLNVKKIECRLRSLQSVIEVISPEGSKSKENTQIRLLHRSFGDFMLSKQVRKISPIWVDEQDAHRVMMERCLATLSRPKTGLRFNICGLDLPGTSRWAVCGQDLERCLTQDLAYACRHLTGHAVSAKFEITDGDEIHQFLLCHLLHWLEASAYLDHHANPAREFLRLQSLASPNDESEKVLNFLGDAYRFAAARWNSLDQAPLQIYTALIFAPKNSIVRKTFEHRYNAWVLGKPAVADDWNIDFMDIAVQPLPVGGILKLLFSPNKEILAAMSWNTVWFMTLLGEQLFRIPIDNPLGDGESPVAVVFSSNSKLIALRNGIDEIEIWNIDDGSRYFKKKVGLFEAKYDADYFHRPRSFTHNDNCVLIASHHFADIWSMESGTLFGRIDFPSAAHEVAVSPDCSLLAGHFDDGLIFWNLESGQQVHRTILQIEMEAPSYDLVLSSNESAWIITKEWTGNQAVYSATSDGPLAYLQEENNAYTIFEDYLVVEYEDDIRIWKHGDKNPQVIEKPRPGPVTTIAYISRPSETLLVSSTTNDIAPGVIFFYKLPKHQPRNMEFSPYLEESGYGDGFSDNFLNSPNGTVLASIGPEGARIMSARRDDQSFFHRTSLNGNIAFCPTGDLFTTSNGHVLSVWDRTPIDVFGLMYSFHAHEGDLIKSASFSLDASFILVVVCGKGLTHVVSLAVPNFKIITRALVPRSDVWEAVLSPDTKLLAMVQDKEVDIWEVTDGTVGVNDRPILTIPGSYHAVQISPNSTLALLIGNTSLEIWHIRQKRHLQSVLRPSKSDATFDLVQDVILTNCGNFAYRIAMGTGKDLLPESEAERALKNGDSLATTPKGPLTMTFRRIGWGIASDGAWITWNDQNWIRLPTDYCASYSAVDGNRVLVLNEASIPAWFEFVDVPVFEERLNDVDVEMTDCEQGVPLGLGLVQ